MDKVDLVLAQWNRERPDLDVVPMGLIGRILRLSRHLTRELEKTLAPHGLNFATFDVLATLRRSGSPFALKPNDLLATMMVSSGSMSNRIDQLEKAGLVRREANPGDGRSVLITLTDTGFSLIDAIMPDYVETQARLTNGLPEKDRALLGGAFKVFLEQFEG